MIMVKRLIFLLLIVSSCQHSDLLTIEGSINNSLDEVSAAESLINSDLIWVIEDAGNDNHLYGLSRKGKIIMDITILNAENTDWEDLTSDSAGNIYIGDFGNNNKKRKLFRILKVKKEDLNASRAHAEIIEFILPKDVKSKDFEAFFLFNNYFYIFSKETKKFIVLKVPNKTGRHEAIVISDYNLKGKHNKITSADISFNDEKVLLLNHDKLWALSGFEGDDFFSGAINKLPFQHNTQKEGVCFVNDTIVILTDERNDYEGGNIYSFNLK
ncbi:hypothetical protein F1003_05610 [Winogradskyella sp. ZXX205]|uniref:SdiA-regulated n=2 Tax=Winogradskyella ouciana TaxID=2608631 RepID=A0A7K1GAS5_9FLAO|nr:hypothetical protein [Winogradskyella ouciana]